MSDWVLTLPAKSAEAAKTLAKYLEANCYCKQRPVAVGEKVYVTYGTDVRLLRTVCKKAVKWGFAEEAVARKTFEQEVKMFKTRAGR